MKFLLAVLNWAARPRDEEGRLLLESNPLRGLKTPKQKNPARVLLADAEYEAMLKASVLMDWRFRVALVIAHETGHEHRTPVTAETLAVLEEARRQNPGIGDAPLLPAPGDPSKSVSRSRACTWWQKAQTLAGLEPKRRRGWHSLRRKFASDLMNQPLKVLCELGGWKTAQTVLQCYQRADEDQLRKALEDRRRVSIPANLRE